MIMYCEKCGTKVPDNGKFCLKCGMPVKAAQSPGNPAPVRQMSAPQNSFSAPPPQGAVAYQGQTITQEQLPAKFAPLGPWAYFGWAVLFTLPFVGWIIALIKAIGNTENVNLKNFARSMFCYICIVAIICGIVFGATGCLAAAM